jgi:hypothetical protein
MKSQQLKIPERSKLLARMLNFPLSPKGWRKYVEGTFEGTDKFLKFRSSEVAQNNGTISLQTSADPLPVLKHS